MDTLNRGQILDLIKSKQGIANPLLALAPFAFINDGEKPGDTAAQEAPKQFSIGLDVIAKSDRLRRVTIAGGSALPHTYALYSMPAGQAVGVVVDEADQWAFLRETELKQAVQDSFGKQQSRALRTAAVTRFSVAEAAALAALIDLKQAHRAAGEEGDTAFSLEQISELIGKPGGPLSTLVLSLALASPDTTAGIEKSLAALEASGWVVKRADGWLPADKSAAFSVVSAGGNRVASLTTAAVADGFVESEDAALVVTSDGERAILVKTALDGCLEWTAFSTFSGQIFFDGYFKGTETAQKPLDAKIPIQPVVSPLRERKKISTPIMIALVISMLVLLCGCGMAALGLMM